MDVNRLQDMVISEKGKQKKPKSFIWRDQNGPDESEDVTKERNTKILLPRRQKGKTLVKECSSLTRTKSLTRAETSCPAKTSERNTRPRCQENISDVLRVKRIIGRMHYTKLIKISKIQSLENTARNAEKKLKTAEKMLQRDEKTFDEFLRDYMEDYKWREKEDQVARKEILDYRRELEGKVRNMKLKISSIEQSIFQLEDTLSDQNKLKALLTRKVGISKAQHAKEGNKMANSQQYKNTKDEDTKKETTTINPIDILDFVLEFVGFEDKNFHIMQEIQKKEMKLTQLQRRLVERDMMF
ncbi:cilia- and flagella-associated protein 100-like [Bolinopsis microptera]|uniref:cilia- and flagella-associated protein 100-like n=1 Tax=Bolinopsis microptera TaxID=2820187 RepID=UPI0030796B2A